MSAGPGHASLAPASLTRQFDQAGSAGTRRRRRAAARQHVKEFAACRDQVREARRFLAGILDGCPAADDAILCLSELASNAVLHSASSKDGGTFTITAEVREGQYVRIEARDKGGPWTEHQNSDGRPHGLDLVASLAAASGVSGDPLTGWTAWAVIGWHPAPSPRATERTPDGHHH